MRNPINVLKMLQEKSENDHNYCFHRLYRNLYNPEFYLTAYSNIYSNKGSMTKGVDGKTLSGLNMDRIQKIIASLKDHSYSPSPVKRIHIPKKSGKKRPLGIPSADDKLVQEIIRMILEAIYESMFSKFSHGFRPNRSCHTALLQVSRTFTGTKWFIEGDIKGCFDNINHKTLIAILRVRIKDEYFISLIWKFLKAGYLENRILGNTYSGAAQGSVISPILANIYLNELDMFVESRMKSFNKGKSRSYNPEYHSLINASNYKRKCFTEKWDGMSEKERMTAKEEIQQMKEKARNLQRADHMDGSYRRLTYVRYADDWLCGVIGSLKDAEKIKQDLAEYLSKELGLELSQEKTLITHNRKKASFLGYEITLSKDISVKKCAKRTGRFHMGRVKLYVPKIKWMKKLIENGAMKIKNQTGSNEKWIPMPRKELIPLEPYTILNNYNQEIRGLCNYYALACNVSVLHKYKYIMEYSMYKTLGSKYRCSIPKVQKRFCHDGTFKVEGHAPNKPKKALVFYDKPICKHTAPSKYEMDIIQPLQKYSRMKQVIARFISGKCELCGIREKEPVIYQIKKMSAAKENNPLGQAMLRTRRKTLILCQSCYNITGAYR